MIDSTTPRGRFAPSPSGRMHLGNVWAGLVAWLSMKAQGGDMVLRVEDLDPQRSKQEWTDLIIDDLKWLGLTWTEGPDLGGDHGPYNQDQRRDLYEGYLRDLEQKDLVYPCFCTRKELRAASAPHREDGLLVYGGTCRELTEDQVVEKALGRPPAKRLLVPDRTICFDDLHFGRVCQNLAQDVGDFMVQRSDGVHAYQLAVTVDDGLMGITEVVRGEDLLDSTPRQIYLMEQMGFEVPTYGHIPLILGDDGNRLSKRHKAMDLGYLRDQGWRPEDIMGLLGWKSGLISRREALSAKDLIEEFQWAKLSGKTIVLSDEDLNL